MKVEVYYKDAEWSAPNIFDAKDLAFIQVYGQKYVVIKEKKKTFLLSYDAIACIEIYGLLEKVGDVEL